jgi:hypothetical protein
MAEPQLNWSTADVHNGKLSVSLDGDLPSGWGKSFVGVAQLLNRGEWSHVKVKKSAVTVDDVAPGDEERLRHFLESAVQQANADHRPPPEPDSEPDAEDDAADDAGGGDDPDADAGMSERFRAFADGE